MEIIGMYRVRGYEYKESTWKLIWLNINRELEISLNLALLPSGEKNKKTEKSDVMLEDRMQKTALRYTR
jgi:hypothetical protein